MKFLIIRFSSIGDIVLTTPVIRCLKKQIPNAEVHFLSKYSFKSILQNNPYIDKLFLLDNDWEVLMHRLQLEEYDYVIDLHNNLRTLKVKRLLKTKSFSFYKLNIEKWLLTTLKINRLPNKHIVDRNIETLKHFNVVNDGMGLDYFISEREIIQTIDIPASHRMGYIAIVIGAALNTKKLPTHKLVELCGLLNHPIILLGGTEDKETGNEIALQDEIKIYNACGKFNLNESADLVRKSKFVITHDTGLMHIAAAFKKPIISIWGNTIPEFGMTAYYGNTIIENKIFEVENLQCRPCSKIGYSSCPKKHFKCMENQEINKLVELASSWAVQFHNK